MLHTLLYISYHVSPSVLQGCAQVSLADFTLDATWLRWYNILSFRFMQTSGEPSKVPTREESSDESTIISSQTSTLTRNQGTELCNSCELIIRVWLGKQ